MIDNETVRKVAYLARIKIDEDKLETTGQEFNKILSWVEQLKELNTDDIKPLISVNECCLEARADEVLEGNCKDEVLANALAVEYGYFTVNKILD